MKETLKSIEEKEFNCIKIVVVGDMRSGKTSLIHRFINDKYPEGNPCRSLGKPPYVSLGNTHIYPDGCVDPIPTSFI
ncbi:unnamed protein product [Oppiella nova]|uniref:Uncharacterized protein n=1 Tax=Oppiella nova TaxID=334625 RepID=A0A7R9LE62_9ACAR|nr:unnamed protein product [Oppiella nova]CAG2162758.1 unnamed protein product [Oppiella nova]